MRRFQVSTVILLGTLTVFLTGCSRNPVSPDLSNPAQGGAASMGVQAGEAPAAVDGGAPATITASFQADEGARLSVGRFTLDLHKNSLRMPATITLRVASPEAMEVEIEVVPAEANDLKVSAELTANLSDAPATNWDAITMFSWENSEWQQFVDYAAQVGKQNVVGKTKHLGVVRVGDAQPAGETIKERKK